MEAVGSTVQIKLNSPEQLLNSFDPSPFRDRDLDDRAASYIIESAEELEDRKNLTLEIELPREQADRELSQELPSAIHNSFRYRARQTRNELKALFRTGRVTLIIGLMVLATCFAAIHLLEQSHPGSAIVRMTEQGLFILGWVANWRPLEIFLYDWIPLRRRILLLDQLSRAPVAIRRAPG